MWHTFNFSSITGRLSDFRASLVYLTSSRPAKATQLPCLKQQQNKHKQEKYTGLKRQFGVGGNRLRKTKDKQKSLTLTHYFVI